MSHPRTFVLVLILLAPLALGVASAKPPQAVPNVSGVAYPSAGSADLSQVALDPTGHVAFVGLRPDARATCGQSTPNSIPGLPPTTPVACTADLAGFDLVRQTTLAAGTQGSGNVRPSSTDATLPIAVAVTPAGPGAPLANIHVVKAGPGDVVAVFRAGNAAPTFEATWSWLPAFTSAAVNKDSTRIALGAGSITGGGNDLVPGSLVMLGGPPSSTMSRRWISNFTNGETVNVLAIAKDANVMAVGTSRAVYFHTDLDSPTSSNRWTKVVASGVQSLDISDDGGAVVVGLGNGEVYYFATRDATGAFSQNLFDAFYSAQLGGSVRAVAVSGDGKWFAAANTNREFALWQAGSSTSGAVAIQKYKDTRPENIVALDAGRAGTTFVAGTAPAAAGGAGSVYGYSQTRTTPAWTLATVDQVVDVAVSSDGNTIAAASATRFYSWTQTSEVTITGLAREKIAQPNELVPFAFTLANTGSLEDNYTVTVHAPFGWFVDGERQTRVLAPDTSGEFTFSVRPPVSAEPKKHLTRVEVFSQGLNKVVAREYLNITLASVSNLRMESDQGNALRLNQGEEIPYIFKIINQGNSYARLNLTVSQAPTQGPPWTVIYPEREQNLSLGGEQQFTVTITAPRDAVDGTCNTITIIATSGRTGSNLPITACINPEFQIALTLDQASVNPKPGETAVVKARIENKGNTKDTVKIETATLPAASALDWRVQVSPTEVELPRNSVRTVTVSIRAAVASPPDVTITVRASSEGAQPQSATISASAAQITEDENGLPGAGFALVVAVGAAAAFVRRRR